MEFTIVEHRSGHGMYCARGRWNDPHCAMNGIMALAFVRLTTLEERAMADAMLRPGEWDLWEDSAIPATLAKRAMDAYQHADRKTRPWAYTSDAISAEVA